MQSNTKLYKLLTILLVTSLFWLFGMLLLSQAQSPRQTDDSTRLRKEVAKLVADNPILNAELGTAVDVDTDVLLVGAPGGNSTVGQAYIFEPDVANDPDFLRLTTVLTSPSGASLNQYGAAVAIRGSTAVISDRFAEEAGPSTSGAVYIYEQDDPANEWLQTQILTAPNSTIGGEFGTDVAMGDDLEGGFLAVAAKSSSDNPVPTLYLFRKVFGVWTLIDTFLLNDINVASQPETINLALSETRLVVGLPSSTSASGVVYIIEEPDPDQFTETVILLPTIDFDGGVSSANVDVSVAQDVIAVGVGQASGGGRVFIYQNDGSDWIPTAQLQPDDLVPGDRFGQSVSLLDGILVAGADQQTSPQLEEGAGVAYVYSSDDGATQWTLRRKFVASDGFTGNQFGNAVAHNNGQAFIGAKRVGVDSVAGAGAVYAYSLGNHPPEIVPIADAVIRLGNRLTVTATGVDFDNDDLNFRVDILPIDSSPATTPTLTQIATDAAVISWTPTVTGFFELKVLLDDSEDTAMEGFVARVVTPDSAPGEYNLNQLFGQANSRDVALGDVDGDGDIDQVIANAGLSSTGRQQGAPNEVWLNDGTGTFTQSQQPLGSGNSEGIALADLNGDNRLDALAVNANDVGEIWLNDGNGSFSQAPQPFGTSGSDSQAIALGDLNNDGTMDAVVANSSGQPNEVWLNDGTGTFTQSQQPLGSDDSQAIALGDFNGDAQLDLFIANNNGQANQIWLNQGDGSFTDTTQVVGNGDSQGVALGDLDRDGDLDAVIANGNGQPNAVWLNNGTGVFSDTGQPLGNGNSQAIALGDIDNDNDLDVIIANGEGEDSTIWTNDGNGVFVLGSSVTSGNSNSVALADLDGDTDDDMVIVDGSDTEPQSNQVRINGEVIGELIRRYLPIIRTAIGTPILSR